MCGAVSCVVVECDTLKIPRGRGVGTHGDVLNVHTECVRTETCSMHTLLPLPNTHNHTHNTTTYRNTQQHITAQHNTTQNMPHISKEKRRRETDMKREIEGVTGGKREERVSRARCSPIVNLRILPIQKFESWPDSSNHSRYMKTCHAQPLTRPRKNVLKQKTFARIHIQKQT